MNELLKKRRDGTTTRIGELRQKLGEAETRCGDSASVYATGSFARGEASQHSDLDLFIAGQGTPEKPALSRLDEILVKADLIEATRELRIPDFSGDGQYLIHYTSEELVGTLGQPEDDARNTFTARLLLLLESSPLLGATGYKYITDQVISAYWRDYEDHKNDFMPAFLTNDILRMWRTFCVNYEARTRTEPAEQKAKRKLKNYKLKHSRLLTCYSALFYLLAIYSKQHTVGPNDAVAMIGLTPTLRLEWLLAQADLASAHAKVEKLLTFYEEFLKVTDASEKDLVQWFLDKQLSKKYMESAYQFGDVVSEVLDLIGNKNRFYRLLVV